jgi:anti-sigma regulatory factor (Ser/Thr protein kinase)
MKKHMASLDNLYEMLGSITSKMEEKGFAMPEVTKVEIACEEALVNIINYAYVSLPDADKYLKINCEFDPEKKIFYIIVKDAGIPFDPFKDNVKKVTLTGEAEEREMGGLGIYFMKKVMDAVCYERSDGENVLKLEKKLK